MVKMDARVNLRLAAATLEPYERLAGMMTRVGTPMNATQLIRLLIEDQLEQVEYLCSCAERALAGDKDSALKVYDAILDWNESQIRVAREAGKALAAPELQTA
jgi:predicted DNA-binding protein